MMTIKLIKYENESECVYSEMDFGNPTKLPRIRFNTSLEKWLYS